MANTQDLAQRYIDSWNQTDPHIRREMVAGLWTHDARYADPMMQADGPDAIAALIAGVQTKFPGFRFALTGEPDGHGQYLRFSWSLGPDNGQVVARGTDFAALSVDGRLAQVTGFLDQIPSAA